MALWTGLALIVSGAWTQEPPASDDAQRRSELGQRQRQIERKMEELETKFQLIAQRLERDDPQRAQRLVEALNQAKDKLILKKMSDVTALLDAGQLDQAEREMEEIIQHLDELVRLLLSETSEEMSRQKELEMLRRWQAQLEALAREQHQHAQETAKIANKEQTLADLAEKIRRVNQLIEAQQALAAATEQNADATINELDDLADQQYELREQTEKLASELDPNPADAKSEPGAEPAGDAKQSDQPGESAEPGAEQGAEQGNDKAEGERSAQSAPAPGSKPLQKASTHQQAAEQDLTSRRTAEAHRAQQHAVEQLQQALDELERERRRIESLPPEALEQMADSQRRTESQTGDLAKEMKNAPRAAAQQQQTPPGEGSDSQPGQPNVERAEQAMNNAAENLDEQAAERAERQQRLAEEELREALRAIEERLSQLRQETQEERLQRLEARFREMLSRQQVVSRTTGQLDDKRVHLGNWAGRDRLTLLRSATEEAVIGDLAQQAYDLLIEDGTSAVFPEMVVDLQEDLMRVSSLLEADETGGLVRMLQQDIETTLEEMLAALKQAQRDNSGGGGGGGGGGGDQPLVRKSAELKLLRAAQLRVNHRTRQIEMLRLGDGSDRQVLDQESSSTAQRQAEIVEMTDRLIDK
jgi:hypothetical protein